MHNWDINPFPTLFLILFATFQERNAQEREKEKHDTQVQLPFFEFLLIINSNPFNFYTNLDFIPQRPRDNMS